MEVEEEHRLIRGPYTYGIEKKADGWSLSVHHTMLGLELLPPALHSLAEGMTVILLQLDEDGHQIREVHLEDAEGRRNLVCHHCDAEEFKWFREILGGKVGLAIRRK